MTNVAEVKEKGLVLSGDAKEKHTLENLNRFLSLVGAQDDRDKNACLINLMKMCITMQSIRTYFSLPAVATNAQVTANVRRSVRM